MLCLPLLRVVKLLQTKRIPEMFSQELGSPSWLGTNKKVTQTIPKQFSFFFLICFLNYSLVENASCLPDRERSGRGKNVQPQSPAAPLALRHVRGEEFSWPGHRAPALPP